jgi:uncharacterized protein YbjQ (UPF0145 family)
MKRLTALLLSALAVTSCRAPYYSSSASIDYSRFSKKDFFFTESNSVNFNYTPIASVMDTERSGYEHLMKDGVVQYRTTDYGYKMPKTTKKLISATVETTLDNLYNNAVQMGANGVINLKVVSEYSVGKLPVLIGYSASGMAIKR